MLDYLRQPITHEAFFKKYAHKRFLKGMFVNESRKYLLILLVASILCRQWAKKYHHLYSGADDVSSENRRAQDFGEA